MRKSDILATALDLFSRYGIKNVSMDDIAKEAKVSKRTLYEFFEDKEALLVEIIDAERTKLADLLKHLKNEPISVVEVFLFFYDETMRNTKCYTYKFYEDLKKYPKALMVNTQLREKIREEVTFFLNKGLKEGVFREDVNFDILGLLAKKNAKMLRPSQAFSKYSYIDVYHTVFYVFFRGICTEKGVAIIDRHMRKKENGKLLKQGNIDINQTGFNE